MWPVCWTDSLHLRHLKQLLRCCDFSKLIFTHIYGDTPPSNSGAFIQNTDSTSLLQNRGHCSCFHGILKTFWRVNEKDGRQAEQRCDLYVSKAEESGDCILVFVCAEKPVCVCLFFLNESSLEEQVWSSFPGTVIVFSPPGIVITSRLKNNKQNPLLSVCVCSWAFKNISKSSFCSPAAAECPCRAEDDSLFSASINLQVRRSSISDDVGNATLRNVIVFCCCQTITVKYILLLFVCVRESRFSFRIQRQKSRRCH